MIKYFSMFTGVGGFEEGIHKAVPNAECIGYSEIDKHSNKVLRLKYPGVKNYGDCTKIEPTELPNFNILVGGFPCQSFSIAGNRMGFEDTRGTLFFTIANIVKIKRPHVLFLENVKGLLNHEKGRTFAVILKTLDELGYDAEWQVLNSKHFGVPQNRERIIIVGHSRGASWRKVFPLERTNKKLVVKSSRKTGVEKVPVVFDKGKIRETKQALCIDANYHKGFDDHGGRTGVRETTNKLNEVTPKGTSQWDRIYDAKGIASTLTRSGSETGLYKIKNDLEKSKKRWGTHYKTKEDISPTLMAIGKTDVTNIIVHSLQTRSADRPSLKKNPKAGGSGHISKENETYCIDTGSTQAIEIPIDNNPVAIDTYNNKTHKDRTPALTLPHSSLYIGQKSTIRRLTPRECERLQGFEDDWTRKGIDEEGNLIMISDSQRYKMMGNAVTVNVIEAVMNRIKLNLKIHE